MGLHNFRPSTSTGVMLPRYDSHCYEILSCNHVTAKQEGTGMNLYQNENHAMYTGVMKTPPQTKVEQLSRMFKNILRCSGAVKP